SGRLTSASRVDRSRPAPGRGRGASAWPRRTSRCGAIWRCVGVSKLEPEGRAVAVGAVEPEGAAMGLDDLAAESETQPGALDAGVPAVGAEELREDEMLLLGRDAEAVVADGDPYGPAVLRGADRDRSAVGGVLDRVREQVRDDPRDPAAVGADDQRLGRQFELDRVRVALSLEEVDLLVEQIAQVEKLE